MTTIADSKAEQAALSEFLEHLMNGVGPLNACFAVGWSPHHLRKKMLDAEFRELVSVAEERKIETLEQRTYELAEKGNLAALQFILMCKAPERGWRPPQQRVAINQQTTIRVENVEAAKQAILAKLEQRDVRALQPAQVIDVDVSD